MSGDRLWAVVLAGGQGVRLRPLARRVCGDDRPKQYVPLLGARTLLEQTLDRVALGIPQERTLVVTVRSHAPYVGPARGRLPAPQLLVQPDDRARPQAFSSRSTGCPGRTRRRQWPSSPRITSCWRRRPS